MQSEQLQKRLSDWIRQHHPEVEQPNGRTPLGRDGLLSYYEHMEIAMLALRLHDRYPEYLLMIRKRRNFLRRLRGAEFTKEQFRSLTAF